MEFTVKLTDQTSGPAAKATAAMVAYADSVNAAAAALAAYDATAQAAGASTGSRAPAGGEKAKKEKDPAAAAAKAEEKAKKDLARENAKAIREGERAEAEAYKAALAYIAETEAAEKAAAKEKATAAEAAEKAAMKATDEALLAAAKQSEHDAAKKKEKDKSAAAARLQLMEAEDKKAAWVAQKRQAFSDKYVSALKGGAAFAAAGAGAIALLAPIAIGYAGMGKLQAIGQRTRMQFRQLFTGVDSSPLIRAAVQFGANSSKTTQTGRVLGDILTRSYNSIFAAVEKAEPYVTAFGQGVMLAFLNVELYAIKAQIALMPLTDAIADAAGDVDGLSLATSAGGIAMVGFGAAAAVAAAPFLPLAGAILAVTAAVSQLRKLTDEWDENSLGQIGRKIKEDLGLTKSGEGGVPGMVTGAEYDRQMRAAEAANARKDGPAAGGGKKLPAAAHDNGAAVGSAMGAGIVSGLDASGSAIEAAGARAADAADRGVRTKAKIKSPSRMMREDGRYMGDGVVEGLDDSAPRVQAAADRSLVPDVGGVSGGGSGGGWNGPRELHVHLPGIRSGNPDDIEAAVERGVAKALRGVQMSLGIPVGAAA